MAPEKATGTVEGHNYQEPGVGTQNWLLLLLLPNLLFSDVLDPNSSHFLSPLPNK